MKTRNYVSVNIRGDEYNGVFYEDSSQNFKKGDKITITAKSDGTETWYIAEHYKEGDEDFLNGPSYQHPGNIISYAYDILTVSRVFTKKLWAK